MQRTSTKIFNSQSFFRTRQGTAATYRRTTTIYIWVYWLEALCVDLSVELPWSFSTGKTPWSSTSRIVFETRHLSAHFELPGSHARLFVIQTSNPHKICTIAYISIYYSNIIVAFANIFGQWRAEPGPPKERLFARGSLRWID